MALYGFYDNGVHPGLGEKRKTRKEQYRNFDDLYAEMEARLLRKYLTPDAKKVSTEGLEDKPTNIETQRRVNATRFLLGLTPMPQVLLDRVNARTLEEQEEFERYQNLLGELAEKMDAGGAIADIYQAFLARGDLRKSNGDDLTLSAFHRWARKARKKVLEDQGGYTNELPQAVIDAIKVMVDAKHYTDNIYKQLLAEGLLKRDNRPDIGFVAIHNCVKQTRRREKSKAAVILALHKEGKDRLQIMEELNISNDQYYHSAVRVGILTPVKKVKTG